MRNVLRVNENGLKYLRMNTLVKGIVLGLAASLVLAGCSQSSRLNQGATLPTTQKPPASLQPAPLTPVNETQLAPAQPATPTVQTDPVPAVPEAPEKVEVAKVDPSAAAQPVTRQAMVGAWTVSSGGKSCQIFLALTKWSGGYRAAARGCAGSAISDVQAWDVKGKQVVLVNASGSTAATLFRSNTQRFDGSTSSGGAISFSR